MKKLSTYILMLVIATCLTSNCFALGNTKKANTKQKKVKVIEAKIKTVYGPSDEYEFSEPLTVTVNAPNANVKVRYRASLIVNGKRIEKYAKKNNYYGPLVSGKAETEISMYPKELEEYAQNSNSSLYPAVTLTVYVKAEGSAKKYYDSSVTYKFVVNRDFPKQ